MCLLKKAYMKALEDMEEMDNDEQEDKEVVTEVLSTIVEQTVDDDDEQNNDDIGLAARIAKRSITSTMNVENDANQIKRLRSNGTTAIIST